MYEYLGLVTGNSVKGSLSAVTHRRYLVGDRLKPASITTPKMSLVGTPAELGGSPNHNSPAICHSRSACDEIKRFLKEGLVHGELHPKMKSSNVKCIHMNISRYCKTPCKIILGYL